MFLYYPSFPSHCFIYFPQSDFSNFVPSFLGGLTSFVFTVTDLVSFTDYMAPGFPDSRILFVYPVLVMPFTPMMVSTVVGFKEVEHYSVTTS